MSKRAAQSHVALTTTDTGTAVKFFSGRGLPTLQHKGLAAITTVVKTET